MERFLWVCLGGAFGTAARYLVALWANERFGAAFPVGTLIVNVTGCFLIGLVMQLSLGFASFPVNLRFALTAGFMGGLTTYSSFAWETSKLVMDGATRIALWNLLGTTVAGFTAAALGIALAGVIVRAQS